MDNYNIDIFSDKDDLQEMVTVTSQFLDDQDGGDIMIDDTVRCIYNAVHFSKIPHWGRAMGYFCEFKALSIFHRCNSSAVCDFVIYWTAL